MTPASGVHIGVYRAWPIASFVDVVRHEALHERNRARPLDVDLPHVATRRTARRGSAPRGAPR